MPDENSPRKRSSAAARRRRARLRRKKMIRRRLILTGFGVFLFIMILVLASLISSCVKKHSSGSAETPEAGQTAPFVPDEEATPQETSGSQTEAQAEPDKAQPPVSLTVSVVGDCTLGMDESFDYDTSLNAFYDNYGSEYFMQNVKSIFEADDLTIANNECTYTESTDRRDRQFCFKAPASYAKILADGDIEAVNLSNNHLLDYGQQGVDETKEALAAQNIVYFGSVVTDGPDQTAMMEVKGVKIGLVGTYVLNEYLDIAPEMKSNIEKMRAEGAQIVIVILHWGEELDQYPDEVQYALGRMAVDYGADLVCGHHAHVIQGIETYKGKNICYGLANFCFGGNPWPTEMDTFIYQQTFTIENGQLLSDNVVNLIPCSVSSDYSYNNYQPTPQTGEDADRIMEKLRERSANMDFAESDSYDYFNRPDNATAQAQ